VPATKAASPIIPHEDLGIIGSVTVTGGTATASPTATALVDTGGPPASSLLTLGATLALVVFGVTALALVRRRNAS
jgi:hypothetical protein